MTGVLNLFLSLIRFVVSWGDRLLFGRFCPNHTGAGTVLTLPFWGAAVCMVFLCYMQIAKGAGSTFGDTVFCLELSIAFVSIAMHYKHYFRMPTVKLKILYFLYLTVLTVVMSYLFIWLFVWVLMPMRQTSAAWFRGTAISLRWKMAPKSNNLLPTPVCLRT